MTSAAAASAAMIVTLVVRDDVVPRLSAASTESLLRFLAVSEVGAIGSRAFGAVFVIL